jgi:hypothetical protein
VSGDLEGDEVKVLLNFQLPKFQLSCHSRESGNPDTNGKPGFPLSREWQNGFVLAVDFLF